jgi:ribA/ribD-fused uncharacterized protein
MIGSMDPRTNLEKKDMAKTEITTETHVFFWSGPFSNWHKGKPFSGERAYLETVARLDALGVARPADDELGSRLLRAATYVCGEQWMMACKAWIFDRSFTLSRRDVAATPMDQVLPAALDARRDVEGQPPIKRAKIWHTALAHVLRTTDPRGQKAIGRSIDGYDDAVWGRARVACVTGGTVARAAADPAFRKALLATGSRTIVEGSPYDRIWGVGLKFDDPAILDEANWRGLNLLGVSHGEAREAIAS